MRDAAAFDAGALDPGAQAWDAGVDLVIRGVGAPLDITERDLHLGQGAELATRRSGIASVVRPRSAERMSTRASWRRPRAGASRPSPREGDDRGRPAGPGNISVQNPASRPRSPWTLDRPFPVAPLVKTSPP
jgi:hypothetical protein